MNNNTLYNELVTEYFNIITKKPLNLTPMGVSELLRYSLCRALQLETVCSNEYIEYESQDIVKKFVVILNKHKINKRSKEYKQGVLESCVHCIELARKEVEKINELERL